MPVIISSNSSIFPTVIHPGMIFNDDVFEKRNICYDYLQEFHIDQLQNFDNIILQRKYALGDIIQLIPVLREFRKQYPHFKNGYIQTMDNYRTELHKLFTDIKIIAENSEVGIPSRVMINLDSILEKDHSLTNTENSKHRVDIYCEGISITRKNMLDWKPTMLPENRIQIDKTKKVIGLQIKGSGRLKTLPKTYIEKLARKLSEQYVVVLLDNEKSSGFEGSNIINTCGKLNVGQVISLLQQIDCVITMDSGLLWLAHCASCPTITLLGPTREHERLSLHPLYPSKCKGISISEMIGCSPCFETKVHCKNAINCMNKFNEEKLNQEIFNKVEEIFNG